MQGILLKYIVCMALGMNMNVDDQKCSTMIWYTHKLTNDKDYNIRDNGVAMMSVPPTPIVCSYHP